MIHNETVIFTQNSIEEYIFLNFFPVVPKNILKNSLTGAVELRKQFQSLVSGI